MQKSNNYKPIGRFIPHRIKDSEGDFSARKLNRLPKGLPGKPLNYPGSERLPRLERIETSEFKAMITFFDNVSPGVPGPNLKVTVATSDDFMLRKKPTVMRSRPIHQWRLLLQSKNINNYSNILGLGQDPLHDCCALDLHAAMPALVAGTNAGAPIRTNKSTLSNLIPKKS